MRTLYLECAMGAAGDMLMGALYQLCPEKERFLGDMNRLLPGVKLEAEPVKRQGIAGTHMRVTVHGQEELEYGQEEHVHGQEGHGQDHCGHQDHHHDHHHSGRKDCGCHDHHDHRDQHIQHHHAHRSLEDIRAMIGGFDLPGPVKERALETYALIAQAESAAHGVEVGEVHFHEVGALDAVMDVTGVCYLMHLLAPERVCASPVTVGSGTVSTAHGLLPVPAPATARLLTGLPVRTGDIAAELCTPTGAALLRTFAGSFGPMPEGVVRGCGYGCGTKDFPRANCVRAFWLDVDARGDGPNDTVTELRANIDDMTGEELGRTMEALLEAGALDLSYLPLQMKKHRPGVLLLCLCRPEDGDRLAREILRHTSTFGVRRVDCARYAMAVSSGQVETELGPVRCKTGTGWGLTKSKPEYQDLSAIAQERGMSLAEVRQAYERTERSL